jgi:TIR domain
MVPGRWDFFISHAHEDIGIVDQFVSAVESKGATCWVAPRNVPAGADYAPAIIEGIRGSLAFLLLHSENGDTSPHVTREVDRAINFDKIIIPVRLDTTPLSDAMEYRLCTVQWVEAGVPPNLDVLVDRALGVLGVARRREQAESNFIYLNRCARCGAQYDENDAEGCTYHPQDPEVIGNWGTRLDYRDVWQFPCCGRRYTGAVEADGRDLRPPRSPGCLHGKHVPTSIKS